jgi:signal transduction histidine kinase
VVIDPREHLTKFLTKFGPRTLGPNGTLDELKAAGEWPEAEGPIALCLYRVAQETLRNVTQHARARWSRVSLERREALVVMRVADSAEVAHNDTIRWPGMPPDRRGR